MKTEAIPTPNPPKPSSAPCGDDPRAVPSGKVPLSLSPRLARENPFSSDRVLRQRYRLSEAEWEEFFLRLAQARYRGALVGPKGSGKTTLLEDLAGRLESRGWTPHLLRLSTDAEDRRTFRLACSRTLPEALAAHDAVLLDGAEQLSGPSWWRFRLRIRNAGALIITTHRAGRLKTLRQCRTTPELLCELVHSLGQTLTLDRARALHEKWRGNLRDALRQLYDEAN